MNGGDVTFQANFYISFDNSYIFSFANRFLSFHCLLSSSSAAVKSDAVRTVIDKYRSKYRIAVKRYFHILLTKYVITILSFRLTNTQQYLRIFVNKVKLLS